MNERYRVPTAESRWKLAAAGVAGLALALAIEIWWQPFVDHVKSLPICESLPYLRGFVLSFAVLCALGGILLFRNGRRILQSGESPPPGALVMFRTRIKSGVRAKVDGWILLATATVLVAAPLVAGYALKLNVIFCVPNACGCQ